MTFPSVPVGRCLISICAISSSISPFLADWSASHVFNPRWPPHAKFHNGQTMSMGLCLGLLVQWYTWGAPSTSEWSLLTAALLGSLYWITGLSAIAYPGSRGTDPEFGQGFPQAPVFGLHLLITWLGYYLERS